MQNKELEKLMKGHRFSTDLKDFYDFAFMAMPTEKFIEFEFLFCEFVRQTIDAKVEKLIYGESVLTLESIKKMRSIANG